MSRIWWPYAWITADQPSRQPGAPANVWPRYLTAPVTPPLSWRCSGRVAASALVCPTAPGQPHRSRAHGTCMAARRDGALPQGQPYATRPWAPASVPTVGLGLLGVAWSAGALAGSVAGGQSAPGAARGCPRLVRGCQPPDRTLQYACGARAREVVKARPVSAASGGLVRAAPGRGGGAGPRTVVCRLTPRALREATCRGLISR